MHLFVLSVLRQVSVVINTFYKNLNNNKGRKMAAYQYTLSQTPTLIADGTKSAYIQEITGSGTRFTQSDTSPNTSTTPYCKILNNDLSMSAGFKLWAWTPTDTPIVVTVITSEY